MYSFEVNEIINKITEICRNNLVSELYLLGSFAKGTYHDRSDIDIVVDGNYNYYKLIDNIMTLRKIDIFEKKNVLSSKYHSEDSKKYAKKIY